jgi:hypothetical protein
MDKLTDLIIKSGIALTVVLIVFTLTKIVKFHFG